MAGGGHRHARFPAWRSFLLTARRRRREYPPDGIVDRLGVRGTDTVMDFGCGPGFFTEAFAAEAGRVVAVDAQPKVLAKARRRLGPAASRVTFVATTDGTRIDVPSESVDLVFVAFVFHELGDPDAVLRELQRTMRPGARLVLMERTEPARGLLNAPKVDPDAIERDVHRSGFARRGRVLWSSSTLFFFEKSAR